MCIFAPQVQVAWTAFDIEMQGLCENDYVELYDGPTENSALVGRYCGNVS